MIPLLLGVAALLAVMAALGVFTRARIGSIKLFGAWVLGLGGLLLAALLLLSGRGPAALAALALLGPSVWTWMRPARPSGTGPRTGGGFAPGARRPSGGMSRAEAYAVLGLEPSANDAEIHAAYVRLMRVAHPDGGGSDWLASRVNQARDTLLG